MRRRCAGRWALLLCAFLMLSSEGCVRDEFTGYRLIRLSPQDSLWRVAKSNDVSLDDLVRANPGLNVARLAPGSTLRVPTRGGGLMERRVLHLGFGGRDGDAFMWPVPGGVINSYFGARWGRRHSGLDLQARRGEAVRAAESGRVIASGWARGYGNYVKIRHSDTFVTLYAHNDVNLVAAGAWVGRGQIIARVGQTGNATGPHLHFEVIRNARARDPLYYLPVGRPWYGQARL
jgi:murein DD-endopeptidase MepM/ murein hydrolase activator NlpD